MKVSLLNTCLFLMICLSCTNKKEQWLQHYAQTKCAYQTERGKIIADSLYQVAPLLAERATLQNQLSEIAAPFELRLIKLEKDVKEAENKYLEQVKKAQAKQSEKYGHISTPDYEKIQLEIESQRSSRMAALQKQISRVREEKESLSDFKSVVEKLKQQDEKIKTATENITILHKSIIDSLQTVLDVENDNFKNLSNELSDPRQTAFKQKRDSIRLHPCKQ